MKPQFSIVIPFFNAAATLPETLASVSAQTYSAFEVLLVNDGSSDDSETIVRAWMERYPQIETTLVFQKNGGLGKARNTGIQQSSHTWLALLDADDKWEPHKLAVIAEAVQQSPADVYYHPVKAFGLKGKSQRPCPRISSINDILIKGNPILPSAVVGKTSLFQKYGFSQNPAYHGAEDLLLWIELLNEDVIFEKMNDPLTLYRETGGMSTNIEIHLKHVLNVLGHLQQQGYFGQGLLARAKRRKYLEVARFYHKRKDFKAAQLYYTRADFKSLKILGLRTLSFLGIGV